MRRAALRQVAPVVETTVLDAYISGLTRRDGGGSPAC